MVQRVSQLGKRALAARWPSSSCSFLMQMRARRSSEPHCSANRSVAMERKRPEELRPGQRRSVHTQTLLSFSLVMEARLSPPSLCSTFFGSSLTLIFFSSFRKKINSIILKREPEDPEGLLCCFKSCMNVYDQQFYFSTAFARKVENAAGS